MLALEQGLQALQQSLRRHLQGLTHAAQWRKAVQGGVDVVIAHNSHLLRHRDATRIEHAHGADGDQIACGNQSVQGLPLIAKVVHGLLRLQGREGRGNVQGRVGHQPSSAVRIEVALVPQMNFSGVVIPHEGHTLSAACQQVFGG